METPQPPWATCASGKLPSQWQSVSWCSERTACVSVCAHCPWSVTGHHWAEPGSVLFASSLWVLYTLARSPWVFSAPGQTASALSTSPYTSSDPDLSASQWHFTELASVCPCLILGSPELDTPLQVCSHQMWSHRCWVEGKNHLP